MVMHHDDKEECDENLRKVAEKEILYKALSINTDLICEALCETQVKVAWVSFIHCVLEQENHADNPRDYMDFAQDLIVKSNKLASEMGAEMKSHLEKEIEDKHAELEIKRDAFDFSGGDTE